MQRAGQLLERRPGSDAGMAESRLALSARQQCELIQNMIDISLSNLRGLRTQCAASNDLAQQEIRTLEAKLMNYISKQLQCKLHVPHVERSAVINSYPRISDWLHTVSVRNEVIQKIAEAVTLDALLEMNELKVKETMKRYGANADECSRLNGALTCLKKLARSGGEMKETLWNPTEIRKESTSQLPTELSSPVGTVWTLNSQLPKANSHQPRSISVSAIPVSDSSSQGSFFYAENLQDPFPSPSPNSRLMLRTPHGITITPPTTPQLKRPMKLKPPRTPPPPSRKVFQQLLPNFSTLKRSKSHESQLGNRIDEVPPIKFETLEKRHLDLPHKQGSPQMLRRDIGISVTHRFSTKSWLSQVCHVCQKSMMFGVKCKHCRLKCHNKCTKEAPPCRISFLPIQPKIRRTESVPSDINNQVDRPAEPHFGTLPKALTKKQEHAPAINHLDSSSNPSSTTSSTPSSPAPFPSSNPSSATTPPNPSPMGQRDSRFSFPEVSIPPQIMHPPEPSENLSVEAEMENEAAEEQEAEAEEQEANKSEPEYDDDELDELPPTRSTSGTFRGMIFRKASQTSVYLQEWDIPFEQIELGELIGQGRWGKVFRGKWHGEVAIRLLEIDGNNEDHLKLFKKEVMNYRQTRHENVVLFMGACMHPPHLAIITSFCKGRTLHSFVRDPKTSLDINKTRQIAQEIIKGMGYLHAKGIVHKDLKSKNVFYENGKVIITDFGLFGISGVVQEGRRENELKLNHDWLCYLAPEIVREMAPGNNEDKLPFSKAADIYAFGTVWYELQARDWPFRIQAAEALIWQIGSGEGVKQVLSTISVGKEVTEILAACWAFDVNERPSFTLLMDMLEKLPKLNRRLSHPGHFWKSADINSSKIVPRFERLGLGILEQGNQKI
ncbi:kinase suppressor of Ras 1 isoform X2 [Pelobates cultripes]|uniref:non-specific serine/threonine protein kinase n=1 Tax=Pelobates cultripes TaxID=61616 RepID=A0AAD1VPC8_PELCU|nr:kinase suppressor of Ras 1 isoform X2 [Pelobates cultripes]